MHTYKISVGQPDVMGRCTSKELSWANLSKRLSHHTQSASKAVGWFVGGEFTGGIRQDVYLTCRSVLTIDIDEGSLSLDELEFALRMGVDATFVAYSTWSHSPAVPRIRLVVPLSREVTGKEYRVISQAFCEQLGLVVDDCSYKPNQFMYLPACPDLSVAWTLTQDGDPWPVPDTIDVSDVPGADAGNDLLTVLAHQPLDVSEDEVDAYLDAHMAEGLDYDGWVEVGMALWHQSRGTWFDKWVSWSEKSSKHDASQMKIKWRSFGGSPTPITVATIIHRVKASGAIAPSHEGSMFDGLLADAGEVRTLEQFDVFARRVRGMSETVLPPVRRAMLLQKLTAGFGAAAGVGKTEIKKELSRAKKGVTIDHGDEGDTPDWLDGWVYIENECRFAHSTIPDYSIRREAFDAKYDRTDECVALEKHASMVALVDCRIPTVASSMYFPGADRFFEYEGKRMLNWYSDKGVAPCETLDADGQGVVDLFLRHVAFTIELEEEQHLLLNWLAYIYQNPGKRIGWAMLLQGAQGSGKTYFGSMLQELLGSNVRQLDTGAISGRFTGWAHGSLVTVVEEIRIAGTNKWEILDKLKPIISNSVIQIEEKGRDHRTVPNFTSYFLLTNHKDAVPLGDGDRRYCCLFSRVQSEAQLFDEFGSKEAAKAYFDKLFDETRRRPDALARFLLDYKISVAFDPIGRAPETSARIEMKALSVSPERDFLENVIEKHNCQVINNDLLDITWLGKLVVGDGDELPRTRAVSTILSEMGYSPLSGRRVKISGNGYHYIWIKGGHAEFKNESVKTTVRNFHSTKKTTWCDSDDEIIPF